jgi:hypothetical protein
LLTVKQAADYLNITDHFGAATWPPSAAAFQLSKPFLVQYIFCSPKPQNPFRLVGEFGA